MKELLLIISVPLLDIPPPLERAELLENTLPLIVSIVPPKVMIPPPAEEELPEKALSITVNVCVELLPTLALQIPPPSLPAELPMKVLLFTISFPLLKMPPPNSAKFSEKVILLTDNVPELSMPPPSLSG